MSGISFRELDPHDRYKLLCGVVVPRPIALVTTLDENGSVNAAPFSFFNVFSEDPPLMVLGLQHKADLSPKDTTRNIHRDGQFVVHMVDEALAAAMNDCAVDFPSGDSEVAATGLATLPSVDVEGAAICRGTFRARMPATCRAGLRARSRTAGRRGAARSCAARASIDQDQACMSISTPTGRSGACSAISTPPQRDTFALVARKPRAMARAHGAPKRLKNA